jgi:hypothetical protein
MSGEFNSSSVAVATYEDVLGWVNLFRSPRRPKYFEAGWMFSSVAVATKSYELAL